MRDDPLAILALRYAARDLPAVETAAFEARLATDANAQDALAEAVRLSAAALGRPVPTPMTGIRGLIADRLGPIGTAVGGLYRRRAYRGHPMAWAGLGAAAAAAAVTAGVWLGSPTPGSLPEYAAVCQPADAAFTVVVPAEPDPAPTPRAATAPLPQPMTVGTTTAAAGPPDDRNPMANAAGPPVSSAGGGDPSPPVTRPKTFLPDTEPPGMNPEDAFRPFDSSRI